MWLRIQIAAYASLVLGYALLLFMAIRHRNGRGPAQRLLEGILLVAALWTLVLGVMSILVGGGWWAFVWRRIAQIGLVILALLTAEFARDFVQHPSRRRIWLGIAVALSLAAVVVDALPSWLMAGLSLVGLGRLELATLLWTLAWLFSTGGAWWICISAYRRATGSKHRNRVRYLLLAVFAFAVGDLLILIGGIPQVHVGLAARLLGLALATFAVMRYDLPDIRHLSLTTVRWMLVFGVTVLVYLLFTLAAGYASGTLPELTRLAVDGWWIVLAWLVVVVADVTLRPHLRRLLDRLLLGRSYDVQRALRSYSQQASLILDQERLADRTLDWLKTTLDVQRSAFILFTPGGDGQIELRVMRATDDKMPPPQIFRANSRFTAHFRNLGRPLSQYDVDMLTWFQTMPADERTWLKDLALDLYIPILVADKPVALLALGPKSGEQPYSQDDVETLMTLAGQAGTALENARLVDDLRAMQDDIHRLGTELAETNRQLQRLDETKSDFIAIASHELRTPLAQIYGYSDILSSMAGDEMSDGQAVHRFIQGISRGARRLKQVVDAMVDVSLIETGGLVLHPVPFPVRGIVNHAVDAIRPAAEQRNQRITVDDLSHLPYLEADSPRIEQVLVGLLSNAVKFTPDGGEITVSGITGSSPAGEAYVELLVADTGIGVDADHQGLIFEKFYRAENPMLHSTDDVSFKGAGPGLGLAIAHGIVKAHGGRIWVESPGRNEETFPGSTFHLRLPVVSPLKG